MRVGLRVVVPLFIVLSLLAWGASSLVDQTLRQWFERDMSVRADLALAGAHQGLAPPWRNGDAIKVAKIVSGLARDERVIGVAACDCDFGLVAISDGYPMEFDCQAVGRNARKPAGRGPNNWRWTSWAQTFPSPNGSVHVSAIPVSDDAGPLGFVILVQDMGQLDRREAMTRRYTFAAFAVLALAASLLTSLTARLSWLNWTTEIRRFLRGGRSRASRPEFQPVLRDVRELVAQITTEAHGDGRGDAWTAIRLRQALKQHLHRERVIILANRQPYIHQYAPDGSIQVSHPASGLVTALEPVLRACSGVWVAHGNGSADRAVVDQHGRVRVPPGEESFVIRRVWLTPEEEKGYYYGFANEGLWPLCHIAHARPIFRSADWAYYQSVNQKFTDAACAEVDAEDPIILVQDYHFALAPKMIRERLPRATILTFWHIPWPHSELVAICPWQKELIQGMLGSSILGFHTQLYCNNFIEAVDRFLEARIDREQHAVVQQGRTTLVRPYPISIECPSRWLKQTPAVAECRASVFEELKLAPDALLGVGVDRLDYTKGIEERLTAVERLLERFPDLVGRFTFAQLAEPSRTAIERYQQLSVAVERLSNRINERFGRPGYTPVVLHRQHHEPPTVFRYYRAADVCYVSSLHDGMNLVAKEFVSARDDERGVLVLSSFTGAARELTEALIVNPYDIEESSSALAAALSMSEEEQRERLRAMRLYLTEFNIYRWAGRMLVDAARLRLRDRVSSRIADHFRRPERTPS